MENSIINALKRLERAGDENSRVTEKLKASCVELGEFIEKQVPHDVTLPRDYIVKTHRGSYYFGKINPDQSFAYDDEIYTINITVEPTRAICLEFAKDISEGLLDEIAEFLEKRIKKEEQAIKIIEEKLVITA